MSRKQNLREAREAKRWTQERLERESGVTQSTISKIERGEIPDPQSSTVEALEKALGLERGTLVFGQKAVA